MNNYRIQPYVVFFVVTLSSLYNHPDRNMPEGSPITISDSIKSKYPCIYGFLKESIAGGDAVCQQNVFKYFLGAGKNRIAFAEKALPEGTAAYTGPASLTMDGVFTDTIFLNSVFLQKASREYLVSVVIHEGIHAYTIWCMLSYSQQQNGVDKAYLQQHFPNHWKWLTRGPGSMNEYKLHVLMSENNVEEMTSCIYAYTNPALSGTLRDSIALSLAWGGLNKTPGWQQLELDTCYIQHVDGWARNINAPANSQFSTGTCDLTSRSFLDQLRFRFPCQ